MYIISQFGYFQIYLFKISLIVIMVLLGAKYALFQSPYFHYTISHPEFIPQGLENPFLSVLDQVYLTSLFFYGFQLFDVLPALLLGSIQFHLYIFHNSCMLFYAYIS